MTDRFEAWWVSNPARVALNPAAKEVARSIWRAAQQDLATELVEMGKETRAGVNPKPYAGMTVQVKLPFPPPYRRVPCQPVGLDEVPEDLPWAATRGKGAAC